MAQVDLTESAYEYSGSKDEVVIVKDLADLPGGASLDTTGYTERFIRAGHVVYRDPSGNLKPLPVKGGAYDAAVATDTARYIGVVKQTVRATRPIVGILTQGQVNGGASPYKPTESIIKGLPRIEFLYVE